MNIILDKSLKTDSKQPKVFELGQITTTLQELLDNSTIVINGEQTIILSISDENQNKLKYLLPLDYKGESFYGLGKNILETDLISLGSIKTIPYKVYTAILTQTETDAPVATVLENTLGNIVWSYEDVGIYIGTLANGFIGTVPDFRTVGDPISQRGNYNAIAVKKVTNDTVQLVSMQFIDYNNDVIANTFIEIRVYD